MLGYTICVLYSLALIIRRATCTCPSGDWKPYNGQVYKKFSYGQTSWGNAQQHCSDQSGDLTGIADSDEYNFIKNCLLVAGDKAWIGFQYIPIDAWIDGTTAKTWAIANTNNYYESTVSGKCSTIRKDNSNLYYEVCDGSGGISKYVCEKPGGCSVTAGSTFGVGAVYTPATPDTGSLYSAGTSVTVSCSVGYEFDPGTVSDASVASVVVTCSSSGSWNELPKCRVNHCPAITTVEHATFSPLTCTQVTTVSGGTCTATCNENYKWDDHADQQMDFQCQSDKSWSPALESCVEKPCLIQPPTIPHAFVTSAGIPPFPYGTVFDYVCDVGYEKTGGSSQLVCDLGQEWTGSHIACTVITCPAPLLGDNMMQESPAQAAQYNYDTVLKYACLTGYELTAGNIERTCQTNNEFSGSAPNCTAISCGPLLPSPNTEVVMGADTYMSRAEFYCAPGNKYHYGDTARVCLEDKNWNGTSLACEEKDCGLPPTAANSTTVYTGRTVNSTATVSCNHGYRGLEVTLSCGDDEAWHGDLPECQEIDCGWPPYVPHTTVVPTGTWLDATAVYTVTTGYVVTSGSLTVTCQEDDTWTPSGIHTQKIDCGPPPALEHTQSTFDSTDFMSTTTYSCEEGYVHSGGNTTSVCRPDGQWSAVDVECEIVECGPLTFPNTQELNVTSSSYGGQVTLACNRGYTYHSGSLVQQCQADGTWDGEAVVCNEVRCPPPLIPAHTEMAPLKADYAFNEVVLLSCEDRYYMEAGDSSLTCSRDNVWHGEIIVCTEILCPPIQVNNSYTEFKISTLSVDATAEFSCNNETMELIGPDFIWCTHFGQWNASIPHCEVLDCGPPPHNNVTLLTYTSTLWGSTVSMECPHGHVPHLGDNKLTCGQSGWAGRLLECTELKCPYPATILYGSLHVASLTVSSNVTYTCDDHYVLQGDPTLTCNLNTTWEGHLPTCQRIDCDDPPKINHTMRTLSEDKLHVTYACRIGYVHVNGSAVKTCSREETWEGEDMLCMASTQKQNDFLKIYVPEDKKPKTRAEKVMEDLGFTDADKPPERIATGSILGITFVSCLCAFVVALDFPHFKRGLQNCNNSKPNSHIEPKNTQKTNRQTKRSRKDSQGTPLVEFENQTGRRPSYYGPSTSRPASQ